MFVASNLLVIIGGTAPSLYSSPIFFSRLLLIRRGAPYLLIILLMNGYFNVYFLTLNLYARCE